MVKVPEGSVVGPPAPGVMAPACSARSITSVLPAPLLIEVLPLLEQALSTKLDPTPISAQTPGRHQRETNSHNMEDPFPITDHGPARPTTAGQHHLPVHWAGS